MTGERGAGLVFSVVLVVVSLYKLSIISSILESVYWIVLCLLFIMVLVVTLFWASEDCQHILRMKWAMLLFFPLSLLLVSVYGGLIASKAAVYQMIILTLFLFVLVRVNNDLLNQVKCSYIATALFIAISGLGAWMLFSLGVNCFTWLGTLHDLGGYSNPVGEHIYAIPCGLGMVLANVDRESSEIFGYFFFRASGWMAEPSMAAMFVAPAAICVMHSDHFKKVRYAAPIMLAFLIACASVASFFAFSMTYVFVHLVILARRRDWRRILLAATATLVLFIFLPDIISFASSHSGYIRSKLSLNAPTLLATYAALGVGNGDVSTILVIGYAYALLVIFLSVKRLFINTTLNPFSLMAIYLVFHGAKGGWFHSIIDHFVMLINIMMLRSSEVDRPGACYGN